MKKGCFVSIIIVVLIIGGVFFILKTSKSIDLSWGEKDYISYKQKVHAGNEAPGRFNLISIAEKRFTVSGKKNVQIAFTSEEISSVLSKENSEFGPIKDIKVKFLTNNEAEATFVLTDKIDDIIKEKNFESKYGFISKGLNGTPVYMKVKVDKASSKTISADIKELDVGRIPLTDRAENAIEREANSVVNNILQNYQGLRIDELKIDNGKLQFKGTVPKEIKSTQQYVR